MSSFERVRLIDANANRAREALRTMEDVARFRLGDGALSGRIKALRHGLRDALGGDEVQRLAHRDTPGDVGTGIKATGEGTRGGLRGVAIAAGKRAGEALRVLEECEKGGSPLRGDEGSWRDFERLRYQLYEVEKLLVMAMGTDRAGQWKLCVLITEQLCLNPWRDVAEAAIEGGADCVQLREPTEPDGALLAKARWLRGLTSRRSVSLIINDRVDIAMLSEADGVHLGVDDLPIAEARRLCGEQLLIGASTHDLVEARRAVEAGADYCGVGAMFASTTKVRGVSGADYLRAYLSDESLAAVPHLAIGGITPENAAELAAAGARGIAVSSVVCGSERPEKVCNKLIAALSASAG